MSIVVENPGTRVGYYIHDRGQGNEKGEWVKCMTTFYRNISICKNI